MAITKIVTVDASCVHCPISHLAPNCLLRHSDTDMFRTSNPSPDAHEQIAAMTALGRIGQPADVADVVAFLAGPDARWLTGQSIRATGGLA